ncbi:nucleotide-binding protein [Nostoc sp.]|uniref:nucleotide-binding protein n=1 Tax=Nostoc sp. TaxID=1180 RepID=UPI002FF64D55
MLSNAGGNGKTTLALHLANLLAAYKFRVALNLEGSETSKTLEAPDLKTLAALSSPKQY